MLVDLDRG